MHARRNVHLFQNCYNCPATSINNLFGHSNGVISMGMRLLSERKRDAEGARIAVTVKSPLGDKNVVAIEFDLDANNLL